jgi:hypothetical protein
MTPPMRTGVRLRVAVTAWCAFALGGCITIVEPPPPPPPDTTVELVNETGFVLDPNFYVSADSTDEGGLFVSANRVTSFSSRAIPTLGGNSRATLTFACDEIRSMGVWRPVFSDPVNFTGGASGDSIIIQRNDEYVCGDAIRFVYFVEDEVFGVRLESGAD